MNKLPKIALGAWAWGNDGTFGGNLSADALRPIFDTAMAHGLSLWDTAYAYGMGTSEKVLAGFLASWLKEADKMGTISGNKTDKSEAFAWSVGENGAPLIDEAKVSMECEVDSNYELEHFDHFVCKILATYADESVLNDKDKIDYHVFKPVLFEFPTYEYFIMGDKLGDCGKMNL